MEIRALIVSDVRLYRDGLQTILGATAGVTVIAGAATLDEARALAQRTRPDVLVLDMAMTDALDHLRGLVADLPDVKLVALGLPETTGDILACAEAGAAGYVPREASVEDLRAALEAAARGELRCSARVAATLLRRVTELSRRSARLAVAPLAPLTPRQLDVLRLLHLGRSNKEIARELGIELPTVKNHVHRILERLDVRGRVQAVVAGGRWLESLGQRGAGMNPGRRAR